MQPEINYRELLKTYMRLVAACEGVDFVDLAPPLEEFGGTEDDMRHLKILSKETFGK